ncbi:hypothetical protein JW960_27865 [candidate division KSB1 bacterium]|nr:hypothetical protein [candidate division KSB1 bacterium]
MEAKKMNRREFFESTGNILLTAAGVTFVTSLVNSCSSSNPVKPKDNTNAGNSTFTLLLSSETSLQQVGGYKTYSLGSTPVITFAQMN